jgi:tRNA (mo5U34)-methyltransferase
MNLSLDTIRGEIARLGPWFHNMDLGGIATAPGHVLGDYPRVKFERFENALPRDLRGRSVLDIGCNAGFYSIEMKRRGADRVLGIDTDDVYLAQARFAADVVGVDIELKKMDVYDVAKIGERFDVVLFMGVLHHLRHPLLALDLIHEHVARRTMVFQAVQRGSRTIDPVAEDYSLSEREIFERAGHPKMFFIEKRYGHDWSNWWLPNRACVEAMLRSSGFRVVANPEEEIYVCETER